MDNERSATLARQLPLNRGSQANDKTLAAKYNCRMMSELRKVLQNDPEADLADILSDSYSKRLKSYKAPRWQPTDESMGKASFASDDIRSRLRPSDPISIISGPSAELKPIIGDDNNLSQTVIDLLAESEVLYKSAWAASVMVFLVSQRFAVKVTSGENFQNECQSLEYLRERLPDFPAPRPHCLVRFGIFHCLFTTFVPGLDLEKVWCQIDNSQKRSISSQLRTLFSQLRSLSPSDGTPLGGIDGRGCSDARRTVRISDTPLMNDEQFQDWIFSGSTTASPCYTQLVRSLMPASRGGCVFTHGDVRPANIIVDKGEDGSWKVVGVIDWEASGFYPEYWESVKATNNLTSSDNSDWYGHLLGPLSPSQYRIHWLVDRIWDRNMSNS